METSAEVLGGSGSSASRVESQAADSPDVNDFALSVTNQGETVYEWSSYKEVAEAGEVELRPSTYTAKAWYGSLDTEGFELPYYEGSSDFQIKKGESTPVTVTCYLANSTLNIVYTDEFKQYFQEYSVAVSTSLGHTVDFSQTEERSAYFTPGKLTVNASVKKAGQTNAAVYKVKEISAEARHAYTLTLDVDAGSATMKVSFSETVSEEERVEFPVTDEALSAPAPYFKANGFTSGENFSMIEGNVLDDRVYAYVNAVGGIVSCNLTTVSSYLQEQGFPSSVNLAEQGEYAEVMERQGLEVKGLSENRSQMAMADFTRLLASLPAGEEHVFTLSDATDLYGKTSGSDKLTLKVVVTPCDFTIASAGEQVEFLSQECKVKVSFSTDAADYKGNPEKLSYSIDGEEEKTELAYVGSETADNKNFTVTLRATDDTKFVEPFKVTGNYSSYTHTTDNLDVGYGIWVAHEGDVWAKKVVFHLFNEEYDNINIQYLSGGTWHTLDNLEKMADYQPGVGTMVAAHGLPSNTTFRFRAVMNDGSNPTNEFEVTTEEELQLPNAGMEYWNYESGGDHWGKWYPWNSSDASTQGWNTLNVLTTSAGDDGVQDFAYVANSGTKQTDDRIEGNYAALIRTVGWGAGNTAPILGSSGWICKNVTPGELYLGTYDTGTSSPQYGYTFPSRPTAVSFYYKYQPKNEADYFEVAIIVKDKDGTEISEPVTFHKTGRVDSYTLERIDLSYVEFTKAASISINFKSSANSNCWEDNTTNLDIPPMWDLGDGEYVGSQLYVDNVKLIYE